MTISTTITDQTFVANAGQTTFIFTIPGFDPSWFVILVDDIEQDPSDYTLTLNSNQFEEPGGTVVFDTPLTGGEVVTIDRRSYGNFLQNQSFGRYSAFPSRSIERALDVLTMGIQDLEKVFLTGVAGPAGPTGPAGPAGPAGVDGISNISGYVHMRQFGVALPALVDSASQVIGGYTYSLGAGGIFDYSTAGTINLLSSGILWLCELDVKAVVEFDYVAGHAFLVRPRLNGTPLLGTSKNSNSGSPLVGTPTPRDSVVEFRYQLPVYLSSPTDVVDVLLETVGTGTLDAVLREMQITMRTLRVVA